MTWFRFLISGENYLLKHEEGVKIFGWATTRYVEASSIDEAEDKASEVIRNDKTLEKALVHTHALKPEFSFEEIYELDGEPPKTGIWPFRKIKTGGGFTFYEMSKE
jgi:hypothetical protein